MKRYLLFAGDDYYPGGGWDDFFGSYGTLAEACVAGESCGKDWWHVVDTDTWTKVKEE